MSRLSGQALASLTQLFPAAERAPVGAEPVRKDLITAAAESLEYAALCLRQAVAMTPTATVTPAAPAEPEALPPGFWVDPTAEPTPERDPEKGVLASLRGKPQSVPRSALARRLAAIATANAVPPQVWDRNFTQRGGSGAVSDDEANAVAVLCGDRTHPIASAAEQLATRNGRKLAPSNVSLILVATVGHYGCDLGRARQLVSRAMTKALDGQPADISRDVAADRVLLRLGISEEDMVAAVLGFVTASEQQESAAA